ncbi:NAD(P)/FAD-dependent oxidoreductase [Chitinophaga sp. XS-30]|uniref:phytoene desaturase family protein n=1 Tax=Chitinophaga sp. XS-30 TaxID=2604421 RepID=UPI0011DD4D5F|nr:NAD(P)/FAD-dependent oxidoreductase [Chitinophaga sp. XS-30]QEH41409.1 NAD(P)/FAD-dependent oxidoreductase [Chitinophaga sp. XS-30]
MHNYDVVIIGSGLGGLTCGAILSRNGYRVCVLEKNQQIGGCLQTFSRDKTVFDSGVHYVGGLAPGQNLYQIFKYLGIIDKLKLKQLDLDCFDRVAFAGDPREYKMAQGYDAFINGLLADFPGEEKALKEYCAMLRHICDKFPLYNLRMGGFEEKESVLGIDAAEYINSLSSNRKLTQVLAGNNPLYAGVEGRTPMYVHALVLNSYIESSWKCVNGGSQIGKWLARIITEHGGTLLRYKEVKRIVAEGKEVSYVETAKGERFTAKQFISNMHPAGTLDMLESDVIRQAYRSRIGSLENTNSVLMVNAALKPGMFPHMNYNYYYHDMDNVWTGHEYTEDTWPRNYSMFITPDPQDHRYANGLSIMAYMNISEVAPWADTFNTASSEASRGEDYEAFKKRKAEKLLDMVEKRFPVLRQCIKNYYVATPLSFRDYIGTTDGSMYGVLKDCNDPLRTFIAARTKLSNLYLTGQNLNMHGILGVTMSAVVTCSELLDMEKLLHEIKTA